jgi:hypothetical protein
MDLLGKIIKEEINKCLLSEVHLKKVDNIKEVEQYILETWKTPNDMWWVKLDARKKDFIGYNKRNNGKNQKWFKSVGWPDGTGRENHVGYAIIRGNTKEEAARSLRYAVVHLNPWAAKIAKTDKYYSNGACEAIKTACHQFFARAYITINQRDIQSTVARSKEDKKRGMFKGREFHHRAGQARTGVDKSGKNWEIDRPMGLVDCDVDNAQAQAWLKNYFIQKGVKIYFEKPSFDGMHYFITIDDGKKCDWDYINRYMEKNYFTKNRPGDPPVLFKPDANAMLYAAIG